MSVILLGNHLLVEEVKMNFYLVVLHALQWLTGEMILDLLSGRLPGFAIFSILIWSCSRLQKELSGYSVASEFQLEFKAY